MHLDPEVRRQEGSAADVRSPLPILLERAVLPFLLDEGLAPVQLHPRAFGGLDLDPYDGTW